MDTSYLLKVMNRMNGYFYQPVRELVTLEYYKHKDGSREISIRYKSGLTGDLKLHDFTLFESWEVENIIPFNMLLMGIAESTPDVNYLIDADGGVDHIWLGDEKVLEPVRDAVEYVSIRLKKPIKSIYIDLLMNPVKPVIEIDN